MYVKDENGILFVENMREALRSYKANGVGNKRLNDARLFQPFDTMPGLVQHLSFYCPEFFNSSSNAQHMETMREKPMFSLSLTDEAAPQDMHWHNYSWEVYVFVEINGVVKFSWQEHSVNSKGTLEAGHWSTVNICSSGQLLVVRPGYCHFLDATQATVLMTILQIPPSRTSQSAKTITKNPVKIIGDTCPQHECNFRDECIAMQRDALVKKPFIHYG